MYIRPTISGYDSSGQQVARRGFFLLVFAHNKFKWSEETGKHWREFPPELERELYACVRKVALRQLGHFMMGTARIAGQSVTISGAYGNDGLPCDYETLTPAARAKLTPVPPDLTKAFWKGGGHNSAGREAPAMREWAERLIEGRIK